MIEIDDRVSVKCAFYQGQKLLDGYFPYDVATGPNRKFGYIYAIEWYTYDGNDIRFYYDREVKSMHWVKECVMVNTAEEAIAVLRDIMDVIDDDVEKTGWDDPLNQDMFLNEDAFNRQREIDLSRKAVFKKICDIILKNELDGGSVIDADLRDLWMPFPVGEELADPSKGTRLIDMVSVYRTRLSTKDDGISTGLTELERRVREELARVKQDEA